MAEAFDSYEGPLFVEITSDAKAMPECFMLFSLSIEKEINKVPFVTFQVKDGNPADADFPMSEEDLFEPGAELTVSAGYGQAEHLLFKGMVTRQQVRAGDTDGGECTIEGKDEAVRMTVGRKSNTFADQGDTAIMRALIENCPGVEVGQLDDAGKPDGEVVQYNCSDWDFLLMRAEANAMVVIVDDGQFKVVEPEMNAQAKETVTYGTNVLDLDITEDAESQLAVVTTRSWEPDVQEAQPGDADELGLSKQGADSDDQTLADVVNLDSYDLQTTVPMSEEKRRTWARAKQLKAELSRIQGSVTIPGTGAFSIGDCIELEGFSDRLNGTVYVTGLRHDFEEGVWTTQVQMGLDDEWFAEKVDVQPPLANGAVAGISGLQIGKVMKIDEDPAEQYRIQVELPYAEQETPGIWARLATPYASNDDSGKRFGTFFVPEIGDEVVLGFLDNHPSHAVVLGSLYSSKRPAYYHEEFTADNFKKGIVTKTQMKLEFDEETQTITVTTPAENQVVIDDENKAITVTDETGNEIVLDPDGITVVSPKDISVTCDGNMDMKAKGAVSIQSDQDVTIKGMNVTAEAQMAFTGKGSSTAELSASGQTTVKGAMVMIN
ncbi:MAG: type VI secretion system tip protein VgrG [Pseudomonadota bacterium]